jgi:hypothetical protein
MIEIRSAEGIICYNCGETTAEDSRTARYYDQESLIHYVEDHGPWSIQEWKDEAVSMAVRSVLEYDALKCPHCGYTPNTDDIESTIRYYCPNCNDPADTPHEALLCCVMCESDEGGLVDKFDGCLAGVEEQQPLDVNYVAPCHCHDDCCIWVCLVCHCTFPTPYYWEDHARTHGVPAVVQIVDGVRIGVAIDPDCSVCMDGETCCEVHDIHRRPHIGHILDPIPELLGF